MARKKRARDSRGRFIKKARARNAPKRRKSARRRSSTPARDASGRFVGRSRATRSRRRNPPASAGFLDTVMGGALDSLAVVGSRYATVMLPTVAKAPESGAPGIAVRTATAIGLGFLADWVMGPTVGRTVLGGALSVPLEQLAVNAHVPGFDRLQPAAVGRYVPSRLPPPPVARRALPSGRAVGSFVTSPPGSGVSIMM